MLSLEYFFVSVLRKLFCVVNDFSLLQLNRQIVFYITIYFVSKALIYLVSAAAAAAGDLGFGGVG